MNLYDVLSSYDTGALLKVTGWALLVFALRLVALPFALITVLLDQAQQHAAGRVADVPPRPTPRFAHDARHGGDRR